MRKLHRWIGVILLLPMLGWLLTALVFFIKPGYAGAYALLTPRTYALGATAVVPQPHWLEYRVLRTLLGEHVLARTEAGWMHASLNGQPAPQLEDDALRRLVADAMQQDPARYGSIASVEDGVVHTDTGVRITLDWSTLSLRQHGQDTDWIDRLYRIHYLQWTGQSTLDLLLGVLGLSLLALLSLLGARLAFRGVRA